jgi:hypothetical protein
MHAAVGALGLGLEDDVLVPAVTDIGFVIGILYQGTIPVFLDLGPATFNLDIDDIVIPLQALGAEPPQRSRFNSNSRQLALLSRSPSLTAASALLVLPRGTDDDQQAHSFIVHPCVDVDPVDPQVHVLLPTPAPLASSTVLPQPILPQPRDVRRRKPLRSLPEDRPQHLSEVPG